VSSILAFRCHQSWRFVEGHFQLYDTTGSYKFSVSVKKMGEESTGGASDIVKAKSFGEDPRATAGLISNIRHPSVNKTKQHRCL
jgi:hypothetical protein